MKLDVYLNLCEFLMTHMYFLRLRFIARINSGTPRLVDVPRSDPTEACTSDF